MKKFRVYYRVDAELAFEVEAESEAKAYGAIDDIVNSDEFSFDKYITDESWEPECVEEI